MKAEEPALGVDLDALVETEKITLEQEREKHRKRRARPLIIKINCGSLPSPDGLT